MLFKCIIDVPADAVESCIHNTSDEWRTVFKHKCPVFNTRRHFAILIRREGVYELSYNMFKKGLVRVLYATYFVTKSGVTVWDNNGGINYVTEVV